MRRVRSHALCSGPGRQEIGDENENQTTDHQDAGERRNKNAIRSILGDAKQGHNTQKHTGKHDKESKPLNEKLCGGATTNRDKEPYNDGANPACLGGFVRECVRRPWRYLCWW